MMETCVFDRSTTSSCAPPESQRARRIDALRARVAFLQPATQNQYRTTICSGFLARTTRTRRRTISNAWVSAAQAYEHQPISNRQSPHIGKLRTLRTYAGSSASTAAGSLTGVASTSFGMLWRRSTPTPTARCWACEHAARLPSRVRSQRHVVRACAGTRTDPSERALAWRYASDLLQRDRGASSRYSAPMLKIRRRIRALQR